MTGGYGGYGQMNNYGGYNNGYNRGGFNNGYRGGRGGWDGPQRGGFYGGPPVPDRWAGLETQGSGRYGQGGPG